MFLVMSEMLATADRIFLMAYASAVADKTRNVVDRVKGASTACEFIVTDELKLDRDEK